MKLGFVCFAVIISVVQITGTPVILGSKAGDIVTDKNGKKIVVGREKYPYMVYLEIRDKITGDMHFCGGAIIAPRVVLTAAHCLTGNSGNIEVYAIAGVLHLEAEQHNAQIIKMYDYVLHEKYSRLAIESNRGVEYGTAYNNDIALIWLIKRFTYSPKVDQIKIMPTNEMLKNRAGFILGWGQTEKGACAKMLRKSELRVIPQDKCEYTRSGRKYILNNGGMLCTRSDTKTTQQCHGDSGGPFIVGGKLAGVISYSFKTDVTLPNGNQAHMSITEHGGVITNVKNYYKWILQNIKDGPPIEREEQRKPQRRPA